MKMLSGDEAPPPWRGRYALYLTGSAAICWGARGLLVDATFTRPANWLFFFVGSILANDVLVAPIVATVALLSTRVIPRSVRAHVQAGLLMSGVVTLVALPVILGFGRTPLEPSRLPLPYVRNLAILLLAVWLGIAAAALLARIRRRHGTVEAATSPVVDA